MYNLHMSVADLGGGGGLGGLNPHPPPCMGCQVKI